MVEMAASAPLYPPRVGRVVLEAHEPGFISGPVLGSFSAWETGEEEMTAM